MHTPSTCPFTCSRVLFMLAIAGALVAHGCSSDSDDKDASGGTGTGSGATGGSNVGGGQTGGSTSAGDSGIGSTLPAPDAVGTFAVKLVPRSPTDTPARTDVTGVVREAALPQGTIWTVAASDGGCKLVTPSIPFCDPTCASGQTCVQGGTCKATDPTHHSVGTVTIEGVGTTAGTTLSMEPSTSVNPAAFGTYSAVATPLNYPPFAEGAAVHLAAAGGDYSAFAIDAKGIPPLVLGTSTNNLAPNQPLSLTWTPPTQAGNSRILINIDISQHGTTKGQIVCDVDDNGSLTIGAALVTGLINLGVAGFPTIGITRQAKGSYIITPGRVDLLLVSSIELVVTVEGYTSCNADIPCPTGQVCQSPPYLCVPG